MRSIEEIEHTITCFEIPTLMAGGTGLEKENLVTRYQDADALCPMAILRCYKCRMYGQAWDCSMQFGKLAIS